MKVNKKPIVFLLGPTASGKTEWAINWQNQFENFEIISVDSVMVYKECNVGSAKPSDIILKKHPHHLVNHVSLNRIFSVADFYKAAIKLIENIHSQNKIPLMVGGSMMYFNLLKNGLSILPSANKSLRKDLETRMLEKGIEVLYADLKKLDPKAAQTIKPKDSQRIIRAIEVITSTGMRINDSLSSIKPSKLEEKFELVEFGIFPKERSELHKRIESRQGELVGENLLEEIIQINGAQFNKNKMSQIRSKIF